MPSELSEELMSTIERLVGEPFMDLDTLRGQVKVHMAKAEQVMKDKVFFDASLAQRLGLACLAMLDITGLDEAARKLVQAAAVYYVEDDDEDGDFSSIVGFEDDAHVLNYVAKKIGHTALAVEID